MNPDLTPVIFEIKGNSLDDGPGIRSVIFFKGCPLDCTWCHNPEGKRTEPELAFDAAACVGCDTCIGICEKKALDRKNPLFVDRERCDRCFQCAESCPSGALDRIGREWPVAEIVRMIARDKPFFTTSGGGVTLSGGEPTLFMDRLPPLLSALKAEGIHILLETCGLFSLDRFDRTVYPYLDMIYMDIKLIDPVMHRRYCGVSNEMILRNFEALHEQSKQGGVPILPRIPLIPEITATAPNLTGIAEWLGKTGVDRAALMAYHPLWREKEQKIGRRTTGFSDPVFDRFMGPEGVEKCRRIFTDAGIMV